MPDTPIVIQQIALKLIRPNPDNRLVTPDMVEDMAASLTAVGLKNPVKMRPLPDGTFDLFSGHVRLAGAAKLGWETIAAFVMDITLEEAVDIAILDNRNKKQTWLDNYRDIEKLQTANPKITLEELANRLNDGVGVGAISRGKRLLKCLNAASRALINQSIAKSRADQVQSLRNSKTSAKIWELTENAVYQLTDLEDSELVFKALLVVIDLKLDASKAKDLVAWVKAGNPPETFTGHKAPKTPKPKPATGIALEAIAKAVELSRQATLEETRGDSQTTHRDALTAFLTEVKTQTPPPAAPTPSFKITSPEGLSLLGQVFKGTQASSTTNPSASKGKPLQIELKPVIHWFKKIPEKVAKKSWREVFKIQHRFCKAVAKEVVPEHYTHSRSGNSRGSKGLTTFALTLLHWAVYGVCQFVFWWALVMWLSSRFVPSLQPWFEWPFRFAARQVLAVPAEAWTWGSTHLFPAIAIGVVLLVLISKAYKVEPMRMWLLGILIAAGFYYGPRWANQSGPLSQAVVSDAQVANATPAPQIVRSEKLEVSSLNRKPKTTNSELLTSNSTPTITYKPSISFQPSVEDRKILEQEMAAIPKNSVVKDYPFTPDETMPGDLAVSRLQDLTDADRYTMKMGNSTEKILSLSPTTTNLILNYKSADALGGFLDGSGQLNFFWEDVKYVHINEIDVETKTPSTIYQCSLIVSGSKNPLTIQCASTEDLEHLVSTLEYFIRSSRLAHDAQPAGLPYLNQGLVFNNLCMVEKLWANSPADKAGVSLTDHLWSVAKATGDPQEKKDFEKGLSSAQVPVTLFVTSDAEWNKALIAKNSGMTNVFRPRLRKIYLQPS